MGSGRVLSLVGRLSRRVQTDSTRAPDYVSADSIVEPIQGRYNARLQALQKYAGNIISDAITHTPERYDDHLRTEVAASISNPGLARTQAINFFRDNVAPVLAEHADALEEKKRYLVGAVLNNARANSYYRGAMVTFEVTARRVKRDDSWSIERKINDFLTEDRWRERYVPIIRKYMEEKY